MGVTTAPTSSVTVTSQDTAVRPAPVKCGNSGSSGTMTVCRTAWNTAAATTMGKRKRERDCARLASGVVAAGVPGGRSSVVTPHRLFPLGKYPFTYIR